MSFLRIRAIKKFKHEAHPRHARTSTHWRHAEARQTWPTPMVNLNGLLREYEESNSCRSIAQIREEDFISASLRCCTTALVACARAGSCVSREGLCLAHLPVGGERAYVVHLELLALLRRKA